MLFSEVYLKTFSRSRNCIFLLDVNILDTKTVTSLFCMVFPFHNRHSASLVVSSTDI
jgi:hypothetical protein